MKHSKSVYTPLAMPQRIEEYFELLLGKADAIQDPFEQAFIVMVHLHYLRPFDDVNIRVSRLAANIPLNKEDQAPLSVVDVPQGLYVRGILGVYELQNVVLLKDVFLRAYERFCIRYAAVRQTLSEPNASGFKYREVHHYNFDRCLSSLGQIEARRQIEIETRQLSEPERPRFMEIVGTELLYLREANISRYRITPSEFETWQEVCNGKIQNSLCCQQTNYHCSS